MLKFIPEKKHTIEYKGFRDFYNIYNKSYGL